MTTSTRPGRCRQNLSIAIGSGEEGDVDDEDLHTVLNNAQGHGQGQGYVVEQEEEDECA